MSLASAFGSALSGLAVSSRLANLVSTNIANAMTPGYMRRGAELSAVALGGQTAGVSITATTRDFNLGLLNDRRAASAAVAGQMAEQSFLARMEKVLAGDLLTGGLAERFSALEAALTTAASRPDSATGLADVLTAAQDLSDHFNLASDTLQAARLDADAAIADQVTQLNTALQQVQDLNLQIQVATRAGRDSSGLQDLRQARIEQISAFVPIRQIAREDGAIALYSTQGIGLLDGRAATFEFTATRAVTADATLANGALDGLTLNGRVIGMGDGSLLAGGSLAAAFSIRDQQAPRLQAHLDAVAFELASRFQATSLDPSLAPGLPGLFTDGGASALAGGDPGLAGRLSINPLADPTQGGALWRLRDGLGTATPGPVGDSTRLSALRQALVQSAPGASPALPPGARTLAGFAADLQTGVARQRVAADEALSFADGRLATLQDHESRQGVDTDQELQALLLIEQAYAANTRVIQALDGMMNDLLEL